MKIFWKLLAYLFIIVIFDVSQTIYAVFHENHILTDPTEPENESCRRTCKHDTAPRRCYFKFDVEPYRTMSKACYDCPFNITDCFRPDCIPAVGRMRNIITVNRQIPGPAIEVCKGDNIIVDVNNELMSDSVTIHWHGLLQKGSPFMDGVPYVTQCPILPGHSFHYDFKADESGTFYWHSHIGTQVSDGLFGPIIIREAEEYDAHAEHYDFDMHTVMINDWSNEDGMAHLLQNFHNGILGPPTILINGRGRYQPVAGPNNTFAFTPMEVFQVEPGFRYRFRLINSGGDDCPMDFSIDNHKLVVISMDGNDIEPVEVDAITIWSGERIDFIVVADQFPDSYWARVNGYTACALPNTTAAFQTAIFRYGDADELPLAPVGHKKLSNSTVVFNPFNIGTEVRRPTNVQMSELRSIEKFTNIMPPHVDHQIFITFDAYQIDNKNFHRRNRYGYFEVKEANRFPTSQLNHITMKFPKHPLLTQRNMISSDGFCNTEIMAAKKINCLSEQCICTHLIKLPLNGTVELVLIDEGTNIVLNHPLHLHGHKFRVIGMENLEGPLTVERFIQLDREDRITRNLNEGFPPLKDTIKVPNGGYSIVRFVANNPGYWLFHCHFEPHMNQGMALVFQVGEDYQMEPTPNNFPRC